MAEHEPTISSVEKRIRDNYDLWDFAPQPLRPDSENFDKFARAWTLATVGVIPADIQEELTKQAELLSKAGTKFRYNGNDTDKGSSAVYNTLTKLKETHKPFLDFGNKAGNDDIETDGTNFDSQAIAAYVFNKLSKETGRPPKSTFKEDKEKIMASADMTYEEKAIKVAELSADRGNNADKTAVFSGMTRGTRNMFGMNSHLVFGKDCLTPVKFIVVYTPDGAEDIAGLKDEGKYLQQIFAYGKYFNIPVYNVGNEKGLASFKKAVEVLSKG